MCPCRWSWPPPAAIDLPVLVGAPPLVVEASGSSHGEALARAVAAARADRLVYLRAGALPGPGWVTDALRSLERHHGAAVVAAEVVDAQGEALPVPAGVAFTGHPLPSALPATPEDAPGESRDRRRPRRTMLPGVAWVARRAEVEAVGSFDLRLDQPFAGLDLAWRLGSPGERWWSTPVWRSP